MSESCRAQGIGHMGSPEAFSHRAGVGVASGSVGVASGSVGVASGSGCDQQQWV